MRAMNALLASLLVVVLGSGCGSTVASPLDGGAAGALPQCKLFFSGSTGNITQPDIPLSGSCPGERTDDGMGHPFIDFQPGDTQGEVARAFSIWQFETRAPAGTVLDLRAGFDPLASRGVSVRYLELTGAQTSTWRADRGTVTIISARDEWYTMQLAGVHLIPEVDPFGVNRATGALQVDGTVFSVLP
jgi:hypothetical protein